ncbi:uncharacterized protein METZ01_LOCUS232259, partial [marine metagenome]
MKGAVAPRGPHESQESHSAELVKFARHQEE